MKTTAAATTLSLLAALIFTLSFALACGDDDSSSATGYFADVEQIFADAEVATNEAEEPLNQTSEAELDVRLSALDTYLGEIDTIFGDIVGRLEDLSVPASAASAHQDFIDGVSMSVSTGNALRNDLTGITTEEQFDDRMDKFVGDLDASVNKTAAACVGLQEIADTENIGVDLACED